MSTEAEYHGPATRELKLVAERKFEEPTEQTAPMQRRLPPSRPGFHARDVGFGVLHSVRAGLPRCRRRGRYVFYCP
ncbi:MULTISPECIES: hypothetical protein [Hydrocarboniphaga]|jgi:hypothetical protein|uniref:Uncharacterized protein n=1 Tax=Hydrocarboniphaga effusa AP103 TaxID=1172194 RepID=I7ZAN0_9GAMM|nr:MULTISPECIES: hypothetical protein [Hydrocarboniphaga]EIT68727.1 hypothetical protein WQQ_39220 [Hydrocarboniphaga effusa AP103]MDZ4076929.1 hypothetical protein [Hydrocarboniphaga sp.]